MYKTNVLHIIDTLGIGGAEKILVGTVNGLPGFQHHVVYLSGSDVLVSKLPQDCKIVKLNCRSKFDIIRSAIKLNKYIRQNRIEIVHSHLFMSSLVARLACPKNVKLFTTIHNLPSKNFFAKSRIARWLERVTTGKRHHLIAICQEVFRDYKKNFGVKGDYTILYNYVDESFYANDFKRMSFNGTFRMVSVGNLKDQKNYRYLLEAFKKMPQNVHLDIYGAGVQEEELRAEIEKYNLNVRLCGVTKNIQQVLPKYDAFIMSSKFEGQPIALLEAMASGMPAILSDIPVLREVTNNNAIFFDLNNIEDVVQKVTAIANHEVNLDEFAKANFERVRKIASRENYMTMLRKLYLEHEVYRAEVYALPRVKIFRPSMPVAAS